VQDASTDEEGRALIQTMSERQADYIARNGARYVIGPSKRGGAVGIYFEDPTSTLS
jgi:hypothetical protein